jgi:hypothetical protein
LRVLPQRFAQMSYFKRSVLEHIAADLLSLHTAEQPHLTRLGSFLRLPPAASSPDASMHRCPLPSFHLPCQPNLKARAHGPISNKGTF